MNARQLYTTALQENILLNIPPILKECEQMFSLLIPYESEEERFFLNASFGVLYKTLLEYDKSYQYFTEASPFAEKYLHGIDIVPFYVVFAKVLNKKELYIQSIETLSQAKIECQNENALELLANIYFELGTNYSECSVTTVALEHFHLCLEIASKLQLDFLITNVLLSIGIINKNIGDFESAKIHLQKSLDMAMTIDSEEFIAKIYFELGDVYFSMGKFVEAEEYLHKCIEYSILSNQKRIESNAYRKIGDIYFPKKNYDLALEYYQKSLTVSATVGFTLNLFLSMLKVATVNIHQQVFTKAQTLLEKASKIIEHSSNYHLHTQLHTVYTLLYHSQKNWEQYETSFAKQQEYEELNRQIVQKKQEEYRSEIQRLDKTIIDGSTVHLRFEKTTSPIDKPVINEKDDIKAFMHLFEHAPLGICITTTSNIIVATNKEFQRIFGYRNNESNGSNFTNLLTTEYFIEFEEHTAKLLANPQLKYSVEEQYSISQKNQIWLRRTTSMSFIPDFDQVVFIHMLENIHERKRAEQELVVTLSKMHRNTDLLFEHKKQLEAKNEEFSIVNAELERKNEQLLRLQIAEQNITTQLQSQYVEAVSLQNSLLPNVSFFQQTFEHSFIFNKVCDNLGAKKDFYWVFSNSSIQAKFIAVADCSISGYSTILLSVLGVSLLTSIVYEDPTMVPSEILKKFHSLFQKTLQSNFESKQYYSFDIGLIKIEPDRCIFSGANTPLYFVKNSEDEQVTRTLEVIEPNLHSIGGFSNEEEFIFEDTVIYRDVDVVYYLTTNGFSKQYNEEMNVPFQKSIKNKLKELSQLSFIDQLGLLEQEHLEYLKFSRLVDDILLIGFSVEAEHNEKLPLEI